MKLNKVAMPLLVCILVFACIMICNTDSVHAEAYDVWVKGVQVTDENMNNVLGDENETVKFQQMSDLETGNKINRLILNNADIQATGSEDLHNDNETFGTGTKKVEIPKKDPEPAPEPEPEPGKDSTTQTGSDGTAFGPGASIEAVEAAMATANMDGDPAGTKFAPLYLKSTKTTKKSANVTWKRVSGAQKYILYGNKCGKKNKMKKIKEFGGSSKAFNVKKAAGKKLKAKTAYKFVLVAVDSGNNVICTSKVVHVMTKGGKFGNYSKVKITAPKKAKKGKLTVNVGKSAKIKGKAYKIVGGKKVKIHSKLMYESTNPKIATINKKTGKLKAIEKGTVRINIFAQNGVYKQVKVTVK